MSPGRSRSGHWRRTVAQLSALARKEFAVMSGRRTFWTLQTLFVGYLIVVVLVTLHSAGGWTTDPDHMERLSQRMTLTLCVFAFLAALFFAPAMAAGALQEEQESGMLEVLRVAPISTRQLFVALVGARMLLALHFLVTALPVFAFPFLIGGASSLAILWRALIAIALGSAITSLYALSLFAARVKTGTVYSRLGMFVVCTPAAWGCAGLFKVGAVLLLLQILTWSTQMAFLFKTLSMLLVCAVFPFWVLAVTIFQDPVPYYVPLTAYVTAALYAVFHYRRARRQMDLWFRSTPAHGSGSRDIRSRGADDLAGRMRHMARALRGESLDEPEVDSDRKGPSWVLLSTRVLENLSGLRAWVYRRTRGNALVVRSLLERSNDMIFVGTAVCVLSIGILDLMQGTASVIDRIGPITCIAFLACSVTIVTSGSRLLPTRQRIRSQDLLLSTPLTGGRVALGYLAVGFLKTWPLMAFVLLIHLIPAQDGFVGWRLPSLVLFALSLVFVVAVVSWVATLSHRVGQRIGIATMALILAVFPAFIIDQDWARYHPVWAWLEGREGSGTLDLFWATGALAAANLLILGGYMLAYDRLSGRE